MSSLSIRAVVAIAILIGLIVGVGAALTQNNSGETDTTAASTKSSTELDKENLPVEVLKALPPEELAEMYPEKAEAILNPEAAEVFGHINQLAGSSDDPTYLRAVLQKMGISAPESASTKELQDLLAGAKQPEK